MFGDNVSQSGQLLGGDLVLDSISGMLCTVVTPPKVGKGLLPDRNDPAWDCVVLRTDGQAYLEAAFNLVLVQRMGRM